LDRPKENFGFVIRSEPAPGELIEQLEAEFFSSESEKAPEDRPHLVVAFEGGDKSASPKPDGSTDTDEKLGTALTFSVSVPGPGPASLAIYDETAERIVRSLWYGADQEAGEVEARWDGTDEQGEPVPAGDYTWKVLQGGAVTGRYLSTIGNGRQPWMPDDVGGYNVENTQDVAVDDDGFVYVCGLGHGRAVMKLSPEGKIVWSGPNTGIVEHPSAIALTDRHVYAANANEGWYRVSRETGHVAPLAEGKRVVPLETKPWPAEWPRWQWPKPFADYPTRLIRDGLLETRDTPNRATNLLGGRSVIPRE
jgi:hypothetical protein